MNTSSFKITAIDRSCDSNKRPLLTSRATLSSINRIKSRITKHFGFETTFRFPSNWKQAYLVFERINFNRLNIQARLGFFFYRPNSDLAFTLASKSQPGWNIKDTINWVKLEILFDYSELEKIWNEWK